MSTVMHGRRKGDARSPQQYMTDQNGAMIGTIPDNVDLRQVTVLSKGDWLSIQNTLNRKQIEEEKIRQQKAEREALKLRSKAMVKNWGNTIQGQRQRKLEARKLREEREEEERKLVDIEEAKYQSAQRKEIIDRAKTQQYYQTDRVKSFHAALLLTEVLKEREAQIELKRLKMKANDGKDTEWLEQARREYEEAIITNQTNASNRIKNAKDTQDFQKSQINEHLNSLNKEQSLDAVEGEELKKLAISYQIEKERLDNMARDERKKMMLENNKQIEDVKRLKALQGQQEEEEDEECRIFAAAKRKMMKLRATKEKELAKSKQTSLEKIREKLAAQMKQKVDDEDGRIGFAVEEAELKRAKEEAEKEKKVIKMIAESAEHRTEQMKEQEAKKKLERRQELEILKIREQADEIFHRNENEKVVRKFQESKNLSDFHLVQANEIKHRERNVKVHQLALDKANVDLLSTEEQQFQEYANKVIDHCEAGGRNVYPLKKAAKEGAGGGAGPIFAGKGGIRPSYMVSDNSGVQLPAYQSEGGTPQRGNSSKRLGFVW